jgi:tetrapyrrole methylase family protein/MazG family protein
VTPPPTLTGDSLPHTRRLIEIVRRLRGEGGCPWDREQTLATLRPHLLEECYEVLDAMDSGDPARHRDELGDLLLQVLLHAQIRSEEAAFAFEDVAATLAEKLIRRHPHVFGDTQVANSREVLANWETIKSKEKGDGQGSVLDGVPRHMPALRRAQKMQTKAARVGFDWSDVSGVVAKIHEELDEIRAAMAGGDEAAIREEAGDLLFAVVNLARFRRVDAEDALDRATAKFARRFREVERRVRARGRDIRQCTLAELDELWEAAKAAESAPSGGVGPVGDPQRQRQAV